jgi:hypothetical protein
MSLTTVDIEASSANKTTCTTYAFEHQVTNTRYTRVLNICYKCEYSHASTAAILITAVENSRLMKSQPMKKKRKIMARGNITKRTAEKSDDTVESTHRLEQKMKRPSNMYPSVPKKQKLCAAKTDQ